MYIMSYVLALFAMVIDMNKQLFIWLVINVWVMVYYGMVYGWWIDMFERHDLVDGKVMKIHLEVMWI